MITNGARIVIEKGCKARGIAAHTSAVVISVTALGADYNHSVKVVFKMLNGFSAGKTFGFYARHSNRLADLLVNLNDGNPTHTIKVRAISKAESLAAFANAVLHGSVARAKRDAETAEPICRRCELVGSKCACEPSGDFV